MVFLLFVPRIHSEVTVPTDSADWMDVMHKYTSICSLVWLVLYLFVRFLYFVCCVVVVAIVTPLRGQ